MAPGGAVTTLLITAVLVAIGGLVYLFLVLREAVRTGSCGWSVLVEPRPGRAPRRLRQLSAGFWGLVALTAGALAVLWAQA